MSIKTKIFLVTTAVILFVGLSLSLWFNARISREIDTQIYDTLAARVQLQELQILRDGLTRLPENVWIFSDETQQLPDGFEASSLLAIAPRAGSLVTPCKNRLGQSWICAFSFVQPINLWIFDAMPRQSQMAILKEAQIEIALLLAVLLGLALAMAYLVGSWFLEPLSRLALRMQGLGMGNYDSSIPALDRQDEIGALARSFLEMSSALKEREKNLSLSAEKLAHSARLSSIGTLGASLAHEIKNPLMSMKGHAKHLAQKVTDESLRESAIIIQSESDRCHDILQRLLRFSRAEARSERLFSIQEVLDSTILLVKMEARERNITLKLSTQSNAIVRGSPLEIQQVVLNLIINAIAVSGENSMIQITVREKDSLCMVEVQDSGPGIPPTLRDKIFEPFFTTKAAGEGSGLGLSVSKEIIEKLGGTISYEAIEPHGSRFYFVLPLQEGAATMTIRNYP